MPAQGEEIVLQADLGQAQHLAPDGRDLPLQGPVWQQREHIEPHSPLQRQVAAIWCEVLGLPQVGLQDDFFALGGH
ncbi:phosphopantetheine-binding protein, partial [uncultured Pseudomonas sp.]|uniref:phosphopantetheine-binding protein n=1 Tax=uncultured Pseudomonas sp. TaxID=114707 RepID=UPI00338FECEF